MSEPTLYRIDTMAIAGLSYEDAMLILSVLVPVERCEHGKVDGHWIVRLDKMEDDWCPGARIGGDDEG